MQECEKAKFAFAANKATTAKLFLHALDGGEDKSIEIAGEWFNDLLVNKLD